MQIPVQLFQVSIDITVIVAPETKQLDKIYSLNIFKICSKQKIFVLKGCMDLIIFFYGGSFYLLIVFIFICLFYI